MSDRKEISIRDEMIAEDFKDVLTQGEIKERMRSATGKEEVADREKDNVIIAGSAKEAIEFNHKLLPERASPYVVDVVDRMNKAPLSFAGVASLAVLSSAIGRRVGVRPKLYDDWTVIPNLWGMLVAPPSIKKSPIYTELIKPLRKAEMAENDKFIEDLATYKGELIVYDIELKKYKERVKKGKDEGSPPEAPEIPARIRYIINDATIEKVAELMIENPLGLLLTLDELQGFFSTLGKAGREGDIAFWLEAFNGNGSKNIDRIGRGSFFVPHVCASIFGTIQPDVISELIFKTNSGSSGGNGLLQRFQLIATVLDSNFEYVDRQPNYTARDEYTSLVTDLLSANPMDYGAKRDKYNEETIFYRFSEEANEIFREWTTDLHKKISIESEYNPAFGSHLGKFDGLFTSLALILFYSDRVSGVTTEDTIPKEYAGKAKELCAFFESQARSLYDMERIKEQKQDQLHDKIINKIQELQTAGELPMSYGELSQKIRGANTDTCKKALKGIVVERQGKVFGLL